MRVDHKGTTKGTVTKDHKDTPSQLGRWTVEDAADSMTQVRHVEIDEQAESMSTQPEVRQHLSAVNG